MKMWAVIIGKDVHSFFRKKEIALAYVLLCTREHKQAVRVERVVVDWRLP